LYLFCNTANRYSFLIANNEGAMMSASVQQQQLSMQLRGNQVYWVWAARGAILLAAGGSVLVAWQAVAEYIFCGEILLQEGECYAVERSGWLCLRADKRSAERGDLIEIAMIEPATTGNYWRRLIEKFGLFRKKAATCGSPAVR
jgi:hypothetical protein